MKEPLSNAIATKLVESKLVETTSKNTLEDQILQCLEQLNHAEDFDIEYQTAPFRNLVPNPNTVTLYVMAFVLEKLIHHKSIVDIYGSDEDIYRSINQQVAKFIPT
ncbi:MAG: hypothetical protein R6U50_12525 [Desulfobacterales bacterium]